jgi:hypothetical protein
LPSSSIVIEGKFGRHLVLEVGKQISRSLLRRALLDALALAYEML